ncbi:MAG: NADH:flavin oxidoreductase/NADH oxidase family protein [Parvularculaceae bacterium]|nr:NADH:flavin oxidoreductase/NADH oxidase family protein [Parvularculaceae bacterium]
MRSFLKRKDAAEKEKGAAEGSGPGDACSWLFSILPSCARNPPVPSLSDPLRLPCGVVLKNRLAKAAMTEGIADHLNRATERHATLYRRWAKGGPALLITGNVMIDRRYLERPGNVAIDGPQTEEQRRRLADYARAATDNGAAIFAQLSHAGRQTPSYVAAEPVGPSAVAVKLPGGSYGPPRALSGEEILNVVERFVHAAIECKRAGFSGVQIHAAHGYLLSEFLNPLANRREDEWGGSLENRARLLVSTVRAVRARVGGGYPVSVKLNSSDFQKGGYSFEECLQIVRWLNDEGVDLLEISGGSYEQPMMIGLGGAMEPVVEAGVRKSTIEREAYFLEYAEKVAEIASMPLMVTGGFRSRAAMNGAIESGGADIIGLARPLCVDPDLPGRLIAGAVVAAPAWEKILRLGPGFLGPGSPSSLVKALNGFGAMAFFYENIYRLADGEEPVRRAALLPAFIRFQRAERAAARALAR